MAQDLDTMTELTIRRGLLGEYLIYVDELCVYVARDAVGCGEIIADCIRDIRLMPKDQALA